MPRRAVPGAPEPARQLEIIDVGGSAMKSAGVLALAAGAVLGLQMYAVGVARAENPSPADKQSPSLIEKINAYVGCINRLSERSYEFARPLLQLGGQERPDRQGAHHLRHLHHLRHGRLQGQRRQGQRARPRRQGPGGRRLGLRRGRRRARTAAEGGRRLLRAGELQGRQDGQGQSPAPAPRVGLDRVRGRRPEAARRHRHAAGQAGRRASWPRSSAPKAARSAITSRR